MEPFFNSKRTDLIQLYIKERKTNYNELGVLFLYFLEDKVDVKFLPLSHPSVTDELRNDITSKNNNRNTYAFFLLIDTKKNDNNQQLLMIDLEKKIV